MPMIITNDPNNRDTAVGSCDFRWFCAMYEYMLWCGKSGVVECVVQHTHKLIFSHHAAEPHRAAHDALQFQKIFEKAVLKVDKFLNLLAILAYEL